MVKKYVYMVDFLIVGPRASVTYMKIFPLVKERRIMFGYRRKDLCFQDGGISARWFQNLKEFPCKDLVLCKFQEDRYKKFDHFDAINIDSISEIPDYEGVMGVPLSFLDYWNPGQFKIVDARKYRIDDVFKNMKVQMLSGSGGESAAVEGKKKFARILIKKK